MNNYDVDLDMNGRNSSSLIIRRIAKNSTVLEFGPANGRMTKYLKETLGCTIYAVELNEESAKDAAEFCQDILVGDIEKFKWLTKYQEIEFDYIIFADVLEHLYNPETVLTKAKTLLKNEGSILISLPNIAHNAIIMDLLNDKFTYKKMGLLDSTHIRFFTKNTLEELITNSGLEIAFETASYAEPSNTEFKNSYTDLGSSVALLLSEREFGEAYQFIFEAKHSASDLETDFLQKDTASLYIDTGKGFNELEKVTTIFNSHKDKVINFTVDSKIFNVKAIRIDPLEIALSLKIENMIVNDIDETNKVKHGAIIIGNNELKFLDSDPQLVIEFDESITLENVALEYKYLTKNYTAKNEKIELQTQQIQDKDTLIENQAQQIQDKDTLIENQAQQ
ncbi:MAG: class I SAM-dependent methyltransferase, partial [Flavobacteriales bacterium]|nr:class I SAM-dependent methyltransferase [Flavobacteriales bacterium]